MRGFLSLGPSIGRGGFRLDCKSRALGLRKNCGQRIPNACIGFSRRVLWTGFPQTLSNCLFVLYWHRPATFYRDCTLYACCIRNILRRAWTQMRYRRREDKLGRCPRLPQGGLAALFCVTASPSHRCGRSLQRICAWKIECARRRTRLRHRVLCLWEVRAA